MPTSIEKYATLGEIAMEGNLLAQAARHEKNISPRLKEGECVAEA
jgi:hypothetical protein